MIPGSVWADSIDRVSIELVDRMKEIVEYYNFRRKVYQVKKISLFLQQFKPIGEAP